MWTRLGEGHGFTLARIVCFARLRAWTTTECRLEDEAAQVRTSFRFPAEKSQEPPQRMVYNPGSASARFVTAHPLPNLHN
jgi:hypothetical protein